MCGSVELETIIALMQLDKRWGKGKEKIDDEDVTFQRMVAKVSALSHPLLPLFRFLSTLFFPYVCANTYWRWSLVNSDEDSFIPVSYGTKYNKQGWVACTSLVMLWTFYLLAPHLSAH